MRELIMLLSICVCVLVSSLAFAADQPGSTGAGSASRDNSQRDSGLICRNGSVIVAVKTSPFLVPGCNSNPDYVRAYWEAHDADEQRRREAAQEKK